jgi:hypothetical protein
MRHPLVLLFTIAALAAAAVAPTAGAQSTGGWTYDSNLRVWVEAALKQASTDQGSGITRKPLMVYVRCYTDRHSFEAPLYRDREYAPAVVAYYQGSYPGGDKGTINMRAGTCTLARYFVANRITQETAGAFKALLHEALHRQGFRNEKETDLFAITSMASAGRLVAYKSTLTTMPGTPTKSWAWDHSRSAGDLAGRLAWQQTQRLIARSYLNSWNELINLNESWSDRLATKVA